MNLSQFLSWGKKHFTIQGAEKDAVSIDRLKPSFFFLALYKHLLSPLLYPPPITPSLPACNDTSPTIHGDSNIVTAFLAPPPADTQSHSKLVMFHKPKVPHSNSHARPVPKLYLSFVCVCVCMM